MVDRSQKALQVCELQLPHALYVAIIRLITMHTCAEYRIAIYRYQVNAKTELAVRYSNQSPLENHHCAIAFQILDKTELNIFANVDQVKQKAIRDVSFTIDSRSIQPFS